MNFIINYSFYVVYCHIFLILYCTLVNINFSFLRSFAFSFTTRVLLISFSCPLFIDLSTYSVSFHPQILLCTLCSVYLALFHIFASFLFLLIRLSSFQILHNNFFRLSVILCLLFPVSSLLSLSCSSSPKQLVSSCIFTGVFLESLHVLLNCFMCVACVGHVVLTCRVYLSDYHEYTFILLCLRC